MMIKTYYCDREGVVWDTFSEELSLEEYLVDCIMPGIEAFVWRNISYDE